MMTWPLPETLGYLAPHLPATLVTERDLSFACRIAAALPEVVSIVNLECHLGGGTRRVDFLACVLAAARARLGAAFAEEPVVAAGCGSAARFLAAWGTPGHPLLDQVPLVWLEYDQPAAHPDTVAPSVLVCLDSRPLHGIVSPPAPRDESPSGRLQLIEAAVGLVLGARLAPAVATRLLACFDRLPRGGHVVHLSVMSGRQPVSIKLNLGLPGDQLSAYLQAIEWPGTVSMVEEMLDALHLDREQVRVDLTISETVAPRLGVECFDLTTRRKDPGRGELLDRCLSLGLCTPAERDALREWAGSARERYPSHQWPTRVSRWIDVKIVLAAGCAPLAKAYLAAMPHFSLT